MTQKEGKAIIFSAPSGSGKTTIVQHLLHQFPTLHFSVSATTRPQRHEREIHGKDYYFLTRDEFQEHIDKGNFIEWEEVYDGMQYGTLKSEIEKLWSAGKHVIFDVDVKGGLRLKDYFGDRALAVFVRVADVQTLEERLRHRNTEPEEMLNKRLAKAEHEMSYEYLFDKTLVSTELEETKLRAEGLITDFLNE
jgi:guanylate kinase